MIVETLEARTGREFKRRKASAKCAEFSIVSPEFGNMIANGVANSRARKLARGAGGADGLEQGSQADPNAIVVNREAISQASQRAFESMLFTPEERIALMEVSGQISPTTAAALRMRVTQIKTDLRDSYVVNHSGGGSRRGLGSDGLLILTTSAAGYAIDQRTVNGWEADYRSVFKPGVHSGDGLNDVTARYDHNRQLIRSWDAIAHQEVNKLLFAGVGAPMALAGALIAAPAILGGTIGGVITGGVALDYGQASLRGLVNGSFQMQPTGGGSAISYLTNGRYGEGAYALLALGVGGLSGALTNAEGFLIGSINVRTPININVQRFGRIADGAEQAWGLRLGSSEFVNRTFNAILPKWNPLTELTSGMILRGTTLRLGIVGPQGFRYPGGSLQFNVSTESVVQRTTTTISR